VKSHKLQLNLLEQVVATNATSNCSWNGTCFYASFLSHKNKWRV